MPMSPQTAKALLNKYNAGQLNLDPASIPELEAMAAQDISISNYNNGGAGGTLSTAPMSSGGVPPVEEIQSIEPPSINNTVQEKATTKPVLRPAQKIIQDLEEKKQKKAPVEFTPGESEADSALSRIAQQEENALAKADNKELPYPKSGLPTKPISDEEVAEHAEADAEAAKMKAKTSSAASTGIYTPPTNPLQNIENEWYTKSYNGTPEVIAQPSTPKYDKIQQAQVDALNKQLNTLDTTKQTILDSNTSPESKDNLLKEYDSRREKLLEIKSSIDEAATKKYGMTTPVEAKPAQPSIVDRLTEGVKKERDFNANQATEEFKIQEQRDKQLAANEVAQEAARKEESRLKNAYLDDLYKEADGLKNFKLDQDRYWNNKSTGQKVLGSIGLILGALGGGLSKGPNQAMQVLNLQIERDLDAQKAAYEAKKSSFAAKNSLYGKMMDKYHDPIAALEASKAIVNDQMARKVDLLRSQTNSERVKMNAEPLLLQLEQNKVTAARDHAIRLYSINHPATSGSTKPTDKQREILGEYNEAAQSIQELETNFKNYGGGNPFDINKKNVGTRTLAGAKDFIAGEGSSFQDLPQPIQDRANSFETAKQYWTGKASVMTGQGSVSQPELVRSRFGNARNEKELSDAIRFLQKQIISKGQAYDKNPQVPIVTSPKGPPLNPNRAK